MAGGQLCPQGRKGVVSHCHGCQQIINSSGFGWAQVWGIMTDLSMVEAESAKDTLCRNVTIYGHCRYEDKGGEHFEGASTRS